MFLFHAVDAIIATNPPNGKVIIHLIVVVVPF